MSNKQIRQLVRILHLLGGLAIGLYIYSPWGPGTWLEPVVKFGVLPALVISGIILWQQPRFLKLVRQGAAS